MKIIALPLVLASALAFAQAPDSAALTGKWKLHQSIAGNENDSDCTLTQKDSDLTGSCTTDQGAVKLTGKVDGKKVSWSYNSDYNGTALTVKFSGTLDSGKITGDVDVDPFGVTGEFTATLAK
jgi:hypothetical protein